MPWPAAAHQPLACPPAVGPGVLIPRPETELVIDFVQEAVAAAPELARGAWADLGTGSGALAVGVARALPQAQQVGEAVHGLHALPGGMRQPTAALQCPHSRRPGPCPLSADLCARCLPLHPHCPCVLSPAWRCAGVRS